MPGVAWLHLSVLQSHRSAELGVPGCVRVWIPCVQARGVALRRWDVEEGQAVQQQRILQVCKAAGLHPLCVCSRASVCVCPVGSNPSEGVCSAAAAGGTLTLYAERQHRGGCVVQLGCCWDPLGQDGTRSCRDMGGCWMLALSAWCPYGGRMCFVSCLLAQSAC